MKAILLNTFLLVVIRASVLECCPLNWLENKLTRENPKYEMNDLTKQMKDTIKGEQSSWCCSNQPTTSKTILLNEVSQPSSIYKHTPLKFHLIKIQLSHSPIISRSKPSIHFTYPTYSGKKMISSKKLVKMIKKWQKFVATQRKRISLPKEVENENIFSTCIPTTSSTNVGSGCFVVYSVDQQRFSVPLYYLNNEIFKELLKMSEEEFGLPSVGPIILPVDGKLLGYIIEMIQRGLAGDIQKALLMSAVPINWCSFPSVNQELINCQILVY